MNATLLLVAGLLAAAPIGYLTLDATTDLAPAGASEPSASAAPATPSADLVVRIHHDGDAVDAMLSLDGAEPEEIALAAGDTVVLFVVDPAQEHAVDFAFAAEHGLDPLAIFGSAFSGSAAASLAGCDGAVEVLFQTYSDGREGGLVVWGASCLADQTRHVAVLSEGPSVALPAPSCPLDCTMGYGFGDNDRMEFEVPEGATSIRVNAWWTAESPFTEEMAIWLTTPDEECGEGCWVAVAQGAGREEVSFELEAPEPGTYALSAFFTMPAGASVSQDIWVEAVVVSS